ncbi:MULTISPECIES: metallophosphoesterase family protein [Silvimonas]|uniref:metallophosphoesterase family protein n=1 Tax=Silvimonas TaxID=300264 RepID=UPI0024B32A43|nr:MULTISPECIES: metallophosphoesterase family protein [Silvimonas]MDR3427020.1 metallophosphoesterase family protein [Silvimonas sp.]
MRFALVSDIHGNLPALEAVLIDAHSRGVGTIVNLGDSLSGPLWPRETAEFLMRQRWIQLAGNHERQLLDFDPVKRSASDIYAHSQLTPEILAWLHKLPGTAWLGPAVFLCHGTPTSDLTYFLETVEPDGIRLASAEEIEERLGDIDADLIACGHTHYPRIVSTRTGKLIVNPGSVGLPAYDDAHPWPHAIENGSPHARYAICEQCDGNWHAELLAVPYDFLSSAQAAAARGFADWERALTTGYVR